MIDVKKAGQTALKFGAGATGLTAGVLAMRLINSKLPSSFPTLAKNIVPGLGGMLLAYFISTKTDNDKLKSLAFGLGLAGFADVLKKTLGDKVAFINDNVPTLSGTGYAAINTGDFPPSYYLRNAFQGVPMNGNDSFSMMGVPMNGGMGNNSFALNGGGAYVLN
jgi:hypothetical protein